MCCSNLLNNTTIWGVNVIILRIYAFIYIWDAFVSSWLAITHFDIVARSEDMNVE